MSKVVFPSFVSEEYQPYEIRQLVSALELRFQSLETDSESLFSTDPNDLSSLFSPIGHTHSESEITDLQSYLTSISGESIFDLSDVTGTPAADDVLVWDGTSFVPTASSGGSITLNDITDVSVPSPNNGEVLTYNSISTVWESQANPAGSSSFVSLTDTDLTGQARYDLVYNADGSEWKDTAGLLQWNPDIKALQIENNYSINWLDLELLVRNVIVGGDTDPDFASVVLQLPFAEADGSTTTIDHSNSAHVITAAANAQVDTAQQKFGTGSGLLDGTGDFFSAADSLDWHVSTGEFTVEGWIRFNGDPGTADMCFASVWDDAGAQKSWYIGLRNNQLVSFHSENGTGVTTDFASAWNPVGSVWYHFAYCRDQSVGDFLRIYIDGVELGNINTGTTPNWFNSTAPLRIGAYSGAAADFDYFNGWFDDVRITKGVCRYPSGTTFTVPGAFSVATDAFTVGDSTINTIIDGLTTNITSPSTDIDGTLNVDGATTLVGAATLSDTLAVAGNTSMAQKISVGTTTVITTSYTAADEHVILVDDDTAAATVTVTLPTAATATTLYQIKKLGTTALVIVDGNASETIDGVLTATLTTQFESIMLVSDGSKWHVI